MEVRNAVICAQLREHRANGGGALRIVDMAIFMERIPGAGLITVQR